MSKVITTDSELAELLSKTKRVAVVGISDKEDRPSNGVSRWLQKNSHFEVYFVNPTLTTVLGNPCYASLADIPVQIDMVDIFRSSEAALEVTEEAIALGTKVVWMQLEIINQQAAKLAAAAGIKVVMNRCPKIELQKSYWTSRLA
mgnify:CR=1 FL=1